MPSASAPASSPPVKVSVSVDLGDDTVCDVTINVHKRHHRSLTFFVAKGTQSMQITTLQLTAGAAPTHVVVADQQGADASGSPINPLPPVDITWALDATLAGVLFVADATGFMFSAPAGTVVESGNGVATYTVNGTTGTLPISVVEPAVTALTFFSP